MLRPGFTLIEIVIAITIVGILLVAVGIPAFRYVTRASRQATEQTLRALKLDIDTYRRDIGEYPTTLQDLAQRPRDPQLAARWKNTYVEDGVVPQDAWKEDFFYRRNAKGAKPPYQLYSWGSKDGAGSPEEEHISVWNVK